MPVMTIHGIAMNYKTAGKGTPVLFIHGLGSSLRDWSPQFSVFTEHYLSAAVDLRGHGNSDKPKAPYSIPMFANDMAALIGRCFREPIHIVGLSMGAAVAFHLAADYPDLVRTAVIANMSAAMPVKTLAQKKFYYSRVAVVKLMGMRKMGQIIAKNVFTKPEHAPLRKTMEDRWADNTKKAYLNAWAALKNWDVTHRLHAIACPVLVIHSERDYTPLAVKQAYLAKIPKATLVEIPDSGHLVNLEKPETFNRIVLDFLKTN